MDKDSCSIAICLLMPIGQTPVEVQNELEFRAVAKTTSQV
jgi:hypothetical protein